MLEWHFVPTWIFGNILCIWQNIQTIHLFGLKFVHVPVLDDNWHQDMRIRRKSFFKYQRTWRRNINSWYSWINMQKDIVAKNIYIYMIPQSWDLWRSGRADTDEQWWEFFLGYNDRIKTTITKNRIAIDSNYLSSFCAIFRGSVSPSRFTITGAFMLKMNKFLTSMVSQVIKNRRYHGNESLVLLFCTLLVVVFHQRCILLTATSKNGRRSKLWIKMIQNGIKI